jgi:hypothetical protein
LLTGKFELHVGDNVQKMECVGVCRVKYLERRDCLTNCLGRQHISWGTGAVTSEIVHWVRFQLKAKTLSLILHDDGDISGDVLRPSHRIN